ncbi:uncharacterized protein LOC114754409 isoform X2 [Neltuma alba]|uniref:uncharacterized protein LOC114754409 isoform X2 n=1 Tax=Neltuma alba TaxID=207710 RepID=UPI0010A57DEC|nr:uncharacterized protein LOC114754409 isoform X2 [Prosopis alba]
MKNGKTMMDPQQPTNGTSKSTKDELVGRDEEQETMKMDPQSLPKTRIVEAKPEERISTETIRPSSLTSKTKVPVPVSPRFDVLSVGGITSKNIEILEEEEEEERGLIATRRQRSRMKAEDSSSRKEHETSLHVIGEPSLPPLPASPRQIPSSTPSKSTYGMEPSFYDANNALSVPGVQEIADMMKLGGAEPSMLAEAFKTHPQLCLSSEYRSTDLLCFSYRVLLNILNILATRNPFTITDADKRMLENYLNDASVLGFDKDWLGSVRMKVFNYDGSEVQLMQQVLNDLGNKLHTKKAELAKAAQLAEMAQKELEAAQSHFDIAQQEHANSRELHSQLLQECQEILEQRDQCWETIAAKYKPFGF